VRRLDHAYGRRRYAILFSSLLFTLAPGPVSATLRLGSGILELFLARRSAVGGDAHRPPKQPEPAPEQLWPSTFFVATGEFSRTSAIHFSFVTLATLGYGDIVPRSDLARGLAVVEGIGGQLFLAVLVTRMVSSYVRGNDDAE